MNTTSQYSTTQINGIARTTMTTTTVSLAEQSWIPDAELQYLVAAILYMIIFILGVMGNLLVILVFALNRQMRDTTNTLIVNLAISDLAFLIFCVPSTIYQILYTQVIGNDAFCKFVSYFQFVTAMCSVWTLVFMALDRFLAVVYPFHAIRFRNIKNAVILCTALWLVSFVVYTPIIPIYTIHEYELVDGSYLHKRQLCVAGFELYKNQPPLVIHIIYLGFAFGIFLLPLSITSVFYTIMIKKLWQNPFKKSNRSKSSAQRRKDSTENVRAKKRITIMVLSVTVIYAICWLPQTMRYTQKALNYAQQLDGNTTLTSTPAATTEHDNFDTTTSSHTNEAITDKAPTFEDEFAYYLPIILMLAAQVLAYSNSCLNPFLYAVLSENFRKGVCNVFSFASGKPAQHRIRRMTRPDLHDLPNVNNSARLGQKRQSALSTEASDKRRLTTDPVNCMATTNDDTTAPLLCNGKHVESHTVANGNGQIKIVTFASEDNQHESSVEPPTTDDSHEQLLLAADKIESLNDDNSKAICNNNNNQQDGDDDDDDDQETVWV